MILTRAARWGSPPGELVDIVIEGDTIAQIRPSGKAPVGDHEIIDVEERVVIPGLWDEHVHFTFWAQHRRRVVSRRSIVGSRGCCHHGPSGESKCFLGRTRPDCGGGWLP